MRLFDFGVSGCLEQTCEANSLSGSASKLCFMASKVSPTGGPTALNTHAHWEHPQPRNSGRSTHTSSRNISYYARSSWLLSGRKRTTCGAYVLAWLRRVVSLVIRCKSVVCQKKWHSHHLGCATDWSKRPREGRTARRGKRPRGAAQPVVIKLQAHEFGNLFKIAHCGIRGLG